jgi:hypothetical protein
MKAIHRKWTGVTRVALVGVLAVSLAVLLGLLAYKGSNSPATFSAFLALLGVAVTGGATSLLTHQSNRRLAQEHTDNRERLRLDAAMRAGSLLAPSKDSPTSPASAASGLLALTQLDHSELAVALLVDLWSDRSEESSEVSDETAVLVIDAALHENSATSNAPLIAAELLCRNAEKLDSCQSLHWPSSIDGRWVPGVNPKTKLLLFDALIKMTMTSEASENALRSLAVRLYGIWHCDADPHVKGCVGVLIRAIIPVLEQLSYKNFLHGPMNVTMDQLRTAAACAERNPDDFLARMVDNRRELLKVWSGACKNKLFYRAGALADSSCDSTVSKVSAMGSV